MTVSVEKSLVLQYGWCPETLLISLGMMVVVCLFFKPLIESAEPICLLHSQTVIFLSCLVKISVIWCSQLSSDLKSCFSISKMLQNTWIVKFVQVQMSNVGCPYAHFCVRYTKRRWYFPNECTHTPQVGDWDTTGSTDVHALQNQLHPLPSGAIVLHRLVNMSLSYLVRKQASLYKENWYLSFSVVAVEQYLIK